MSARTAVETIQAAIEKLEDLRQVCSSAPWTAWKQRRPGYLMTQGLEDARGEDVALAMTKPDAELTETLHRTIDAQLAILQFGIKRQEAVDWTHRLAGDKHREAASLELDLARAILGESS